MDMEAASGLNTGRGAMRSCASRPGSGVVRRRRRKSGNERSIRSITSPMKPEYAAYHDRRRSPAVEPDAYAVASYYEEVT